MPTHRGRHKNEALRGFIVYRLSRIMLVYVPGLGKRPHKQSISAIDGHVPESVLGINEKNKGLERRLCRASQPLRAWP